jgi:hypothetical protein
MSLDNFLLLHGIVTQKTDSNKPLWFETHFQFPTLKHQNVHKTHKMKMSFEMQ